jgi:adenosylcobinamide-GDP ribazoletransferase
MPKVLRHFLIAVQFLTRIPVPGQLATGEQELGKAASFFPVVGAIVGCGAALVFLLSVRLFPLPVSVLIAIAFTAFLTNGFHEDGLADTFDGLGGGWTKERALEIMRDSRLGTYGTLALIFLLLGKFTTLSSLAPEQIWRWLIVGHVVSRWTVLPLCAWLPYARAEGQGKLVAKQINAFAILFGTTTLLLILLVVTWKTALIVIGVAVLVTFFSGLHFKRRLDGITGDCLGATNQLTELAIYLTALAMTRF